MGIHKTHIPGQVEGKLRVQRAPDGSLRVGPPAGEEPGAVHPETIAEERPPQAPDPRPNVPPNVGPV